MIPISDGSEIMHRTLEVTWITLLCCLVSIINYCANLIDSQLFIPLTIIPIYISFVYGLRIPATMILCIGIIDDVLLNTVFGAFAFTYSIIAYLLSLKGRRFDRPEMYVYIITVLYIVSNVLLFIVFK